MLALNGGKPLNTKKFIWNSSIDDKEKEVVLKVLDSKILSGYYGSYGENFLGGKQVRELEKEWAKYFGINYAAAVNSCTSGLYAAVGAIGISPGDEVIVPPYTMSATVAAILGYHGIPVFADIEDNYFCIDPINIEKKITKKTKAIIVVNLFGQSADLKEICSIARKYNLKVIEDNAQAPGAKYNGKYTGTIGDIGVFSLNCHKIIQCGEGGVVVSDDLELIKRIQLIRNHAEAVVGDMGYSNLSNMLGQNYRMTELQAAIARVQLKKLKKRNNERRDLALYLNECLKKFDFIEIPKIRDSCTHVYYLYMLKFIEEKIGISRELFLRALNAEGYQAHSGYVEPIYFLPLFKEKIVFGKNGYPFIHATERKGNIYRSGLCKITERLQNREIWYPDLIRYLITEKDIKTFSNAIEKVLSHLKDLKG